MNDATLMMPQQHPCGLMSWHDPEVPGDPESQLRAATKRRVAAVARLDQMRADEREAIAEAADAGIRQVEIVEITGYTREHVRRIVSEVRRERDVEA